MIGDCVVYKPVNLSQRPQRGDGDSGTNYKDRSRG